MTTKGAPTIVDLANAAMFANQQVAKLKCNDPELVSQLCDGLYNPTGEPCIKWRQDKSAQSFPKPSNMYRKDCTKDSDCDMGHCDTQSGTCTCYANPDECKRGYSCIQDPNNLANLVCGYAPPIDPGHCVFMTKDACNNQKELPYTCDSSGYCTDLPSDKLKGTYVEWHPSPGTSSGGGTGTSTGSGKCVIGDSALKMWCENPGSRCVKNQDTGEYPPECSGGKTSNGVTDVPPFFYDDSTGKCFMTHDYCDAYGMNYNKGSCSTDSDCAKGETCFPPQGTNKHCTGPGSDCQKSKGQEAGEFFVGKTLFYLFKKNFKCETFARDERSDITKDIKEKFKTIPDLVCSPGDERKMHSKKMLFPNFAGQGINLYMISWKTGKEQVGFSAQEVEKVYPDLVDNTHISTIGKLVCMNKEDIKGDKNRKRIYMTLGSKGWMFDNIMSLLTSLGSSSKATTA